MKKLLFLFFPFLLFSAPINDAFNQKNLKFKSYLFLDFGYVNDLFFKRKYKHYKNKSGKNFAVLFARVSVGYHKKNYDIGFFAQEDYLLLTNKDTAEFAYQLLNHEVLENKKYNVRIRLKGFETKGIYFNKIFVLNNLKLLLGNDLYAVTFMQDGKVSGYGIILDENNYDYYAHADYFYTRNLLYKRKVYYKYGYGYNMHFGLKYKKDDFIFRLLINNLFSYIKIKNTPYSNVYLNSKHKHYDKNGYITYSPLFYGKEYYKDYIGSFDKKYDFFVCKKYVFFEYFKWRELSLKYVGFKQNKYRLFYEMRNKSFGMEYFNKYLSIHVESNNFNYKKAKLMAVYLGLNFHF